MNSMIYKKKSPLLLFLVPAFLFLIVYLLPVAGHTFCVKVSE